MQERRITPHLPLALRNRYSHVTPSRLCLEFGILGHARDNLVKRYRSLRHDLLSVFQPGQSKNPPEARNVGTLKRCPRRGLKSEV